MRASEKKIIQRYLMAAHNNALAAKILSKTQPRSAQYPTLSQEEVVAYREYQVLCHLAKELDIPNPCKEDFE